MQPDFAATDFGGLLPFEQSLSAVEPYQHDPMLPPEFFDMRHAGRSGESQED